MKLGAGKLSDDALLLTDLDGASLSRIRPAVDGVTWRLESACQM
jgi:hypothetical protein